MADVHSKETRSYNMKNQSSIYDSVVVRSEQPTTCPICGNRTEIILDLSHVNNQPQIHYCMSKKCKFTFVEEADSDN